MVPDPFIQMKAILLPQPESPFIRKPKKRCLLTHMCVLLLQIFFTVKNNKIKKSEKKVLCIESY